MWHSQFQITCGFYKNYDISYSYISFDCWCSSRKHGCSRNHKNRKREGAKAILQRTLYVHTEFVNFCIFFTSNVMSGRKRGIVQSPGVDKDETYLQKRQRNNEAVNRTRQKKRQEESETTQKVDELREENEQLERKVESLQKELSFLKEMFVAYAQGNKKSSETSSGSSSLKSGTL
uniref:BZIP domain-containing protein n=1 Tax=Heterorhabditis bacteriophora TaxID=37862 RepID=A0A1I7WTT3_HETBA